MAASRQIMRLAAINPRFIGYSCYRNNAHAMGDVHHFRPPTLVSNARRVATVSSNNRCNTHTLPAHGFNDRTDTCLFTNQYLRARTELETRAFSVTSQTQPCWNCGREIHRIEEQHFCKCGMIQPPLSDKNHFEVLGMEEHFDINLDALTNNFRDLQRKLHPDKFTMKSETEQEHAREQSSRVNQAYKILQKPLPRAQYMLELHGFPIEEGEIQIDPVFLMDIMEINEQIAESSSGPQLERINKEAKQNIRTLITEVSEALKRLDYAKAKFTIAKMKYHVNIEEKAEIALENLNA